MSIFSDDSRGEIYSRQDAERRKFGEAFEGVIDGTLNDDIDPSVLTSFVKKVKPKEEIEPIWTTIDPFVCFCCKKENRFEHYNPVDERIEKYKVPIFPSLSLPCRHCHVQNIVIDPYDYRVMWETRKLGNLLIY